MRTVGIDPATCTGLALVGDLEDRGKTVKFQDKRGFLRLQLIANDLAQTLAVWEPEFAAVEGYAYVKNITAFVTLVEIGTVIRMTLRKHRIPWVEVPPAVLKKWTTGKGNATKGEMAYAVKTRWDYKSPSHDIVDAFALAQMAQLGWTEVLAIKGVSIGWEDFSG
jgi:Holliday junction resolvasome, endonuclease subunit